MLTDNFTEVMLMVVIHAESGHVEMTGTVFMVYANCYHNAAVVWHSPSRRVSGFDPVPYSLLCQSLELHLKSFIWLKDRIGATTIKNKYGHNIEKLWTHAKARGIDRYARTTDLRDRVISLVGSYYRKRQLNYLDLDMIFHGYKDIKSEPRAILTLKRLTHQLGNSLRQPILQAS